MAHFADQQSFGENVAQPGGHNHVAFPDILRFGNIPDHTAARSGAANHSLHPRPLDQNVHIGTLVNQEQNF